MFRKQVRKILLFHEHVILANMFLINDEFVKKVRNNLFHDNQMSSVVMQYLLQNNVILIYKYFICMNPIKDS